MIGQQNFQNGVYPPYLYRPYETSAGQQYPNPNQPGLQTGAGNNQQVIQYSGVVFVRSEEEARSYPVGPGYSVVLKNETSPYIYTKTMGFNQLETPIFKKYLLVEEETDVGPKSEVEELREQIQDLRNLIETKLNPKSQTKKIIKEETAND